MQPAKIINGADSDFETIEIADRPRPKREYKFSRPSRCLKSKDRRDKYTGCSGIIQAEFSYKANRQKNAGDKPKFKSGRRQARRTLNEMREVAMICG